VAKTRLVTAKTIVTSSVRLGVYGYVLLSTDYSILAIILSTSDL